MLNRLPSETALPSKCVRWIMWTRTPSGWNTGSHVLRSVCRCLGFGRDGCLLGRRRLRRLGAGVVILCERSVRNCNKRCRQQPSRLADHGFPLPVRAQTPATERLDPNPAEREAPQQQHGNNAVPLQQFGNTDVSKRGRAISAQAPSASGGLPCADAPRPSPSRRSAPAPGEELPCQAHRAPSHGRGSAS